MPRLIQFFYCKYHKFCSLGNYSQEKLLETEGFSAMIFLKTVHASFYKYVLFFVTMTT